MPKYWYAIPCRQEIGEYTEAEGITDFPRGTYLAYNVCCLVTGLESREEALEWNRTHTCPKHPNKKEE